MKRSERMYKNKIFCLYFSNFNLIESEGTIFLSTTLKDGKVITYTSVTYQGLYNQLTKDGFYAQTA